MPLSRARSRSTGAILMASGRVPKTERTVFRGESGGLTRANTTGAGTAAQARSDLGSGRLHAPPRQGEGEGRALAHRRLDPDLPAVLLDDPLRDHEPQPRAARFAGRRGVELGEPLEQTVQVALGDPAAVVLDRDG